MNWLKRKRTQKTLLERRDVLLVIDWDNFDIGLRNRFEPGQVRIEQRLKLLIEWVKTEVGELFGGYWKENEYIKGYGFVFAPEHLSSDEFCRKMCVRHNLRIMTCPKNEKPDREGSFDSVDQSLMSFAESMMVNSNMQSICIVSGDDHYIPLMCFARKRKVKVAFVAPTIGSLSKDKTTIEEILRLVDNSSTSGKRMFLRLDTVELPK